MPKERLFWIVGGVAVWGGVVAVVVPPVFMLALVFGPTFPYPFVEGVPEQSFKTLHWYFWTAVCVTGPKYPVILGYVKSPVPRRNSWSAETWGPEEPKERLEERVRALAEDAVRRKENRENRMTGRKNATEPTAAENLPPWAEVFFSLFCSLRKCTVIMIHYTVMYEASA
jgi:hypothetical protein